MITTCRFGVFFGLMLTPLMVCPAKAAGPLQAYTQTPAYKALITTTFDQTPPQLRCSSMRSDTSSVTEIVPVQVDAGGVPVRGAWLQRFPVSGCGHDTTLNLFFHATPGGVQGMAGVPGGTNADPVLQHDALPYAHLAVDRAGKGCDALVVLDSALPRAEGSPTLRAPWQESWTMAGCGHVYAVPLSFIPDASGTTISASGAKLLR